MKTTKPDKTKFSGNRLKEKIMKKHKYTEDFKLSHIVGITLGILILFFLYPRMARTNDHVSYDSIKGDGDIKISFTGDVSPSRYILESFNDNFKPKDLYTDVKEIWEDSDITLINLEAVPLRGDPKEYTPIAGNVILHTDEENLKAIKESGIDLINLANNHFGDFGRLSMVDAMFLLEENDMDFIGAGFDQDDSQIGIIREVDGLNIGIQNITDVLPISGPLTAGTNTPGAFTTSHINYLAVLEENFKEADYNIVVIHWGTEYTIGPNKDVNELGRELIDRGADLVIGSHPHVLHPVEKYNGGTIVYSMGNAVFDQVVSRTNRSAIGSLYIGQDGSEILEFVPIYLFEGRPEKTENTRYLGEIFKELTKYLEEDEFYIENNRLYIILD